MEIVETSGTRKDKSFTVFVFGDGGTERRVDAREEDSLHAVLEKAGFPIGETTRAFVPLDADDEVLGDEEDDGHGRDRLHQTLGALGIGRGGRVVCSSCHRIAVEILYQNRTLHHAFAPRARVRRVIRWAAHRLNIETDDLHLKLCGGTEFLSENKHLGQLVQGPGCKLCVELVLEPRVQG